MGSQRQYRIYRSSALVLRALLANLGRPMLMTEITGTTGLANNIVQPIIGRFADDGWVEMTEHPTATWRDPRANGAERPRMQYRLKDQAAVTWARCRLEQADRVGEVKRRSPRLVPKPGVQGT